MRFLVVAKNSESQEIVQRLRRDLCCDTEDTGAEYDGIIVLGGDGTVLRALSFRRSIPKVYAINFGRVGFLCPIAHSEIDELVARLRDGREVRLLEVRRLCLSPDSLFLNEAVLRSSEHRLNTFTVSIDNVSLVVRADAIIVASRMGSSGYSISAQGPLLLEEGIVVNALAPNKCGFRPIVCSLWSRVRVEIDDDNPVIVVDGVVSQERRFEVFHDGSTVQFGYLEGYDESARICNLFLLNK